ncbi:hypothetical protein [Duganella vulcania]|uniref:Uncharacterized protein n=1 Tax=Duganella vulcania TaxID=2692166 RepID=A0A845GG90_9BURK|nr:hypothetical protein [Duganella vulcania]MYM92530.1 hypothetical protein [Duganella vulcania]
MERITAASVLRAIVDDGFLSESNVARAREVLSAIDTDAADAPAGDWRDVLVGMRFVNGELRPSVRSNPEALYLASDVHSVLIGLMAAAAWAPIGEAPRDGTKVLLARDDDGVKRRVVGYWALSNVWASGEGNAYELYFRPTYYMRMPELPASE